MRYTHISLFKVINTKTDYVFMLVVCFYYCLSGEHLSEEYEKLNPLKKVPVIDDDGFILRERYVHFIAQ